MTKSNNGLNRLPTEDEITFAHDIFCAMVENQYLYTMDRRMHWERFLKYFNIDDLKLYLRFNIDSLRKGKAGHFSLTFSYLIERKPEDIEEKLIAIRATNRKKVYSKGKREVLQSFHLPSEPPSTEERSAKTIMEQGKLVSWLQDWKKKNL